MVARTPLPRRGKGASTKELLPSLNKLGPLSAEVKRRRRRQKAVHGAPARRKYLRVRTRRKPRKRRILKRSLRRSLKRTLKRTTMTCTMSAGASGRPGTTSKTYSTGTIMR